jgi:lipopolysaccharide/colanic/teichoic acid biosynthesis glycosyltransferase
VLERTGAGEQAAHMHTRSKIRGLRGVPPLETTWDDIPSATRAAKRALDVTLALAGLLVVGWLIPVLIVMATLSTGEFGLFRQQRVGRGGRPVTIWKIRTMRSSMVRSSVAAVDHLAETRLGVVLRRYRLDELPQLVLVFIGRMSFVGPRPDVPGFADELHGTHRRVLALAPGMTGLATLFFADEEDLLMTVDDPEIVNRELIYPAKVCLNLAHLESYTLGLDVIILAITLAKAFGLRTERLEHRMWDVVRRGSGARWVDLPTVTRVAELRSGASS